jgi:hypothetical protein
MNEPTLSMKYFNAGTTACNVLPVPPKCDLCSENAVQIVFPEFAQSQKVQRFCMRHAPINLTIACENRDSHK